MARPSPWRGHMMIAAIVGAALTIAVACGGALSLVDATGERLIANAERDSANGELELYTEFRREEGREALVRAVARHARLEGEHHVYAVADANGRLLAGNLTAWPDLPREDTPWIPLPTVENGPDAIHVAVHTMPDGTRMLAGRDDYMQRLFSKTVFEAALVAIAIVVIACLIAPAVVMGLTMRSVRELADTAAKIARGEFAARAPVHGGGGPFDRIARAQNLMLDRIEDLVTGLKTVTDSLAHDLRTPLSRLRARIEGGLGAETLEAKQTALETALSETDSTIHAFSSLIDIARAEGGLSRDAMLPVDLAALVRDVHELFLPMAEESGVQLVRGGADELVLDGHRPLLMQALGNLVHNAIKHAPSGTAVSIALERRGSNADISVADRGPGIPEQKRQEAVMRFSRLGGDASEGVGLGLAIVEACARLHRGALALEDNDPGLRAVLTLSTGSAEVESHAALTAT